MSHHRNAIKDLGSESLVGITDLVSGEKDPRNLMIIFSILRVLMLEWDISGHAEVFALVLDIGLILTLPRFCSTPFSAIFQSHFVRLLTTLTASRRKT